MGSHKDGHDSRLGSLNKQLGQFLAEKQRVVELVFPFWGSLIP